MAAMGEDLERNSAEQKAPGGLTQEAGGMPLATLSENPNGLPLIYEKRAKSTTTKAALTKATINPKHKKKNVP